MAYSLRRGEPIDEAATRIIRDQTNAALAVLLTAQTSERSTVALEARKRCKKVRGVLRLVREPLGDQYRVTDQAYRAVAHALAARREAEANLATFDRLLAASPREAIPPDRFCLIREELARRAAATCEPAMGTASTSASSVRHQPGGDEIGEHEAGDPAATAARLLSERLEDLVTWSFAVDGWSALNDGVHRTYRRGITSLDQVIADPSPDGYHELRKRAKYTWYHLRLLRRSARSVLVPFAEQFHRLTIGLGDVNDLAELAENILASPDAFGGEAAADHAIMVMDERRTLLEDGCLGLAVRLYAEPPDELSDRLGRYWRSWQRYGDEQPLRSIRPRRVARSSSRTGP
ncbi:MAG: CHAD domain-containing protein [Acidimicrobiales bacterium]